MVFGKWTKRPGKFEKRTEKIFLAQPKINIQIFRTQKQQTAMYQPVEIRNT